MPAVIHDGQFSSIVVNGNLTVSGNISGNTTIANDSINIQKLDNNLFTVPYYFGQRLNINASVNNLRIRVSFLNNYGEDLFFTAPPFNTIQIWLNFYDSTGSAIANPDTPMSTAFIAGFTAVLDNPSGVVHDQATYFYDIELEELDYEKPDNAESWSVSVRPYSDNFGTMEIGRNTPINSLAITAWP